MAVNMQSLPPPLRHLAVSPVNSDNSRNTSTIEADSIEGANVDPSTYSSYSITSSIRDYEVLDGRTYQRTRDGAYIYPNDEAECERLDIHHELNMMIRGDRLHLAPIKGNEKILEIGCGTGAWCIDIGDKYPEASIIGTDLSPVQPQMVPTNVSFFVDDANEEDWLFPKDEFGYIHTAVLLGSFQDFFTIIKRAHSYIAPGGYMESFEMLPTVLADDDSMPEDWPLRQWARDQHEAQMLLGKPIRIGPKLKAWYEEAGFVDVQERIVKVPIGTWPKDLRLKQIGHLYEHNYRRGLGAWSTQVFRQAFSWNRSEIEVYLANVRRCLDDKHVHAYNKIYIIWGRKPFPGEVVASTMQPPVLQPQPQRRTAATVAASTLGSATSRPARARPSTAGATSSGV